MEVCTDSDACNYDADATISGGCEYAADNYNCEGECTAGYDCNDECGGSAELDDCGDCDGDGPNVDCWDGSLVCNSDDCPPEPSGDHFIVDLDSDNTGASQLTIFSDSITSLESGDV